ncbi:bifunctional transcriptional activator/DNA repair enzyme AdaA [Paenibacillus sp. 1P07SE]|uniref:bifunctional transcriptional activator/DNA repair enzyme AdaA n=1 Tax=Paenibacillus sp. 1P07SE TaxID=3132209 RepID=UPI0039A61D7A
MTDFETAELRWQAVLSNNASQDGLFWYAVRTTGIFCRPSCKSRPPKRENIAFYDTPAEALADGFRPCKRCRPTGSRLPDEEWVAQAAACIDNHFAEELSLQRLAEMCHGSPYHLQRTFKRILGLSPLAYLQHARIRQAQELLHTTGLTTREIGARVGMANLSYFTTLFKRYTGTTPAHYRSSYKGG